MEKRINNPLKKSYEPAFKQAAVARTLLPRANIKAIAKELHIPAITLRRWRDLSAGKSRSQPDSSDCQNP